MMIYLDLQTSRKVAPNENYARELMELFTMGLGNYTELDVREAARALTGWTVRDDASVFNPKQHDDGSKNFLGRTGNLGMDDVIDQILAQPATAPFVATRVARYFVTPSPSADYIRRLAGVLVKTRWDLKGLLRTIFLSQEFVAPAAYRALVKSPAEYVAGALRAVGGGPATVPAAVNRMASMDQVLFDPPTVAGWPSDAGWITSNTVLGRMNFVQDLITRVRPLPDDGHAIQQLDNSLAPQTAKVLADLRGPDHWYAALISAEFQLK